MAIRKLNYDNDYDDDHDYDYDDDFENAKIGGGCSARMDAEEKVGNGVNYMVWAWRIWGNIVNLKREIYNNDKF